MATLITILIILACLALAFFVLIQNPKGGGLNGSFGSMSTQVMGVQQSDSIMERGTWILIGVVGGLCLVSVMFMEVPNSGNDDSKAVQQKSAPAKKK
jgi:preprotein translocase subunit SecG